ncbi:MAG TPA: tetratricopeptide repeat protein [Phycisphaerae bacterium]
MQDPRLATAEELFFELVRTPADARSARLTARCAGDPELRCLVEELLRNDDSGMGDFLRAPVPTLPRRQPARIGRYEIVREIGRGGAGVVYEARQEHPSRTVALKVLDAAFASAETLRRFEHEAEILANLQDPGIAQVYEAGMAEIPGLLGLPARTPWFAMERVEGEPITTFCDRGKLSVPQRLALFAQVCQAVQHAHTKGVIHRDLKPSNVLAGLHGDRRFCKIIDFGIAKLTQPGPAAHETLTQVRQWVGTPAYMSPEQVAGSRDIDTRSDVYALGVLLYELFTGVTPFDSRRLREAELGEIQRLIREVDPPAPSARVAALPDDELAAIAARRALEPPRLAPMLRGELDWIILRALEKDRTRRYDSPGGLAADVERHQNGEAVEAAPPGTAYRMRKFVRQHRGGVATMALIACSLLIGLGAAVWQAWIAAGQRDTARAAQKSEQRERRSAERVSEFMRRMLDGAGPEISRGRDPTLLRTLLEQAVVDIERGELRDAPAAEADLRIMISTVYRTLSDIASAERLLEPVVPILNGLGEDGSLQERYLEARAMLLGEQGRVDEAIVMAKRLVDLRRRMFGPNDRRVAESLASMGWLLSMQGKPQEAASQLREALQVAEASGDQTVIANALTNLSDSLGALGQNEEAVEASQRALELYQKAFPGDHPHVADALNNLATALMHASADADRALDLLRESVAMKRRLYPDGHPHLGISLNNLAFQLQDRGQLDEAEQRYREALEVLRKFSPEQDGAVAMTLINLAGLRGQRGDSEQRELLAREGLALSRRVYPDGHPHTAVALMHIAASLRARGAREEGVAAFTEAAEIMRRVLGPQHPHLAMALDGAGLLLIELERFEEATPLLREALTIRQLAKESDRAAYASALAQLATALLGANTLDAAREAESLARESFKIRQQILANDDWRLPNSQSLLGGALSARAALDSNAALEARLATLGEAESMLISSFEQLDAASQQISATTRTRILVDAAARVARLYRAWDSLDASAERRSQALEWDAKSDMVAKSGR